MAASCLRDRKEVPLAYRSSGLLRTVSGYTMATSVSMTNSGVSHPVSRSELQGEGRLITSSSSIKEAQVAQPFLSWDQAKAPPSYSTIGTSGHIPKIYATSGTTQVTAPAPQPAIATRYVEERLVVPPQSSSEGLGVGSAIYDAGAATASGLSKAGTATADGLSYAGHTTGNALYNVGSGVVSAGEYVAGGLVEEVGQDFHRGATTLNPLNVVLPKQDVLYKVGYNPVVRERELNTYSDAAGYHTVTKPAEAAVDLGSSFLYKPVVGMGEVVRGLAADTVRVTNDYVVQPVIEPVGYAAGGVLGGTAYGLYHCVSPVASAGYHYILQPMSRGVGYALEWTGDSMVELGGREVNYAGRSIEDGSKRVQYSSASAYTTPAASGTYKASGTYAAPAGTYTNVAATTAPTYQKPVVTSTVAKDEGGMFDFLVYPWSTDGEESARAAAAKEQPKITGLPASSVYGASEVKFPSTTYTSGYQATPPTISKIGTASATRTVVGTMPTTSNSVTYVPGSQTYASKEYVVPLSSDRVVFEPTSQAYLPATDTSLEATWLSN